MSMLYKLLSSLVVLHAHSMLVTCMHDRPELSVDKMFCLAYSMSRQVVIARTGQCARLSQSLHWRSGSNNAWALRPCRLLVLLQARLGCMLLGSWVNQEVRK